MVNHLLQHSSKRAIRSRLLYYEKGEKMRVRMVSASAITFTEENCVQSLRSPDKNIVV